MTSFLVGCLVLLGWAFDVTLLKSILPGLVSMKPNTAIAFLLAGTSLSLWQTERRDWRGRRLAQLCAFLIALVGLLTLGEYLFGWDLGIDQLMFRELPGAVGTFPPGRMALNTALVFSLLGGALLLLDVEPRRGYRPAEFFALVAGVFTLLALMGYTYSLRGLYTIGGYTSMALHTALTFAVLCAGILCARPDRGLMTIFVAGGLGGVVARRLLPAAIIIPWLVSWIRLHGERAGLYGTETGLALFTTSNVVIFALLVWLSARSIHRADIQRLAAEARFRGIIETAPDAIVGANREGRIVLVNAQTENAFGYNREELLGQPVEILLPERLREAHVGRHAAYLSRAGPQHMGASPDLLGRRKDGSEFPVDITLSTLETEEGILVTSIIRDITEQQRAEGELERFFTLSLDLFCIAGFDRYFKRLNPAWERTLGFTGEELLARSYLEFVHPDDRERTYAEAQKLTTGIQTISFENRYQCKDGSHRWLLWNANPWPERQWVYATARDITERKQAEEEIRKLNQDLERHASELAAANKELEAFTYSVSHDLRAPLRHIDGFSKILLEQYGSRMDASAQHYLQRIREGVRHMAQLVDDLLNLSRVGRQEVRLQITGMNALVEEVRADLKEEARGREVEWRIGSLPFLECDPGMMKQVFANLLSNALKFSRPRERAVIQVDQIQVDGRPAIFVCDNGVGFSMKYADKLFGVFQRLHRQEDFEGTGVGLATVQRIIHKHGGRIWAEAELDRGATFYFTLGTTASGTAEHSSLEGDRAWQETR